MLFRISVLLALVPVSRALFGHSTQELFRAPLLNSSDDAKDVLTAKIALEIPRIQAVVASPSGTYAALLVSELSLEADKTAYTLQIVHTDASSDAPSLKLAIPAAGEIFWYDDSTLIFGITDSAARTTSLYAHYVSLVTTTLPPGELVGILPTDTAANFRYSYSAQALVFSDYVFPDGDLSKAVEHDRAWEDRKDTALTYDGSTYTRIFNKYYGPKRSSLFSVRLTVDFNGRWELAQDYVNLLAEAGHHSPVEGILGPREHFGVSGLSVVYTAKDPLLPEAYHNKQNIYLTDIFGQTSPRELTSGKHGATSMPVFSPGEQKIAWLEQATDGNEADKNYVVIFDVARNSTVTLLKDWDRSPTALSFSPDGLHLYMTVPDNARVKIFTHSLVQSPSSRPLEPTPITQEGAVSDLQALPGGRLLFKQQSMGNPGDACVLDGLSDAKKTRIHKLTHFARDSLSKIEKPDVAEFTFKGAEGRRVHGLIVKPVGWTQALSKKRTWPVVFAIHGGPEFFTGDMWSSSGHPYIFSHHGYFFVAVNPTGSTSFGRNLTNAIIGDWGGAPFEDLRKGFKHALRIQPEIDSSRAVAWGASYGGYAINWIQSNPGFGFNFTALACFAGIFDLRSFAYAVDQNYFMNYEWTGRPWEESVLEKFAAQSPSNFVHRWSTPELVIHGDIDFRVPVTEGLAVFSALQQRGVPSRLVIFKEESHGITKPHNLVIYYEELFRWFDHFVGLNDTVF